MQLLIGGQWTASQSGREEEVTSPFDGAGARSVPIAGAADVDAALTAAVAGARVWRTTPGHERMRILVQAAALADERTEDVAQTISAEAGTSITEARAGGVAVLTPHLRGLSTRATAATFTAAATGVVDVLDGREPAAVANPGWATAAAAAASPAASTGGTR